MAEWRFLRGWSSTELAERLQALQQVQRSFSADPEKLRIQCSGWHRNVSEYSLGREPIGPPAPGGLFARAWTALVDYSFSAPRIVVAHFDAQLPLLGRRMLLELKALGLRFLCGVLVGAVWRDADTGQSWAGYRYDSLWGHIETGAEWFVLRKHHRTGEVRLRIEAVWRAGQLPTWWSRIGFALLRPLYLRLWQRRSVRRLVASAPAAGK